MRNIEWEESKVSKSVHVGVIGCGDIASARHIPALHAHSRITLAALCDVDYDRAAALSRQYNVPSATNDYRDMLQNEALDAVVIATPPWITPAIAVDALRSGKDVLCEKPMALDLDAADEVIRAEQETGRRVQVGFTYRHGPLLETMRTWIREGRLGAPLIFRFGIFDETWDPSGNPDHLQRIVRTMETGTPFLHDGAHIADFLHFLTGSAAVRVDSFGAKTRDEFPCPNYNVSMIQFANGDMAKVEIGWLLPKFPRGEFEVAGPLGLIVLDRKRQTVTLHADAVRHRLMLEEDWVDSCFRIQLDAFIDSVRNHAPCVPGTAEGRNSLQLTKWMESAMKSSAGSVRHE